MAAVVEQHVRLAGIDVGGFSALQVRETIASTIRDQARAPITLRHRNGRFELAPRALGLELRVKPTMWRVMHAPADTDVLPVIRFRHAPIRDFLDRVGSAVAVAPVNAAVRIHLTRISHSYARAGRRLAVKQVGHRILRLLADPSLDRSLRARTIKVRPAIDIRRLRRLYPSIITVQKSTFTLRLFRHLRYARSYSVAVGQPAYPTPEGLFAIQSKQVNPTWTAPNSPWAGELAGQSFDSSDPGNPLKARWMGVTGSVGIHGTGEDDSIGTAASHGCIRMHVRDVINLFDRVSIGTPVLIG